MKIPGRGDLRISLTPKCNLACSYCHNEGQLQPWDAKPIHASIGQIDQLIDSAYPYNIKTISFTGGDPGSYINLPELINRLPQWVTKYPNIEKWKLVTNGTPFFKEDRLALIKNSALTHINISVDSIEPNELSRPSSPVGRPGNEVFNKVALPLHNAGKEIKIDCVFTGNETRTLNVVKKALDHNLTASIIQVNGVMGSQQFTHGAFALLQVKIIKDYNLTPVLILDEVYGYKGNKRVIGFYPDRCSYRDCNNCRLMHMRVNAGMEAVPCFEQSRETIKLFKDNKFDVKAFEYAIDVNGRGPEWKRLIP